MIFYNPRQVFTRRSTHSQHPQAEQWLFARAEIDAASMFTCPQKAWGKVIFVQRCSARFACFLDLKSIWGLIRLGPLCCFTFQMWIIICCNLLKSQFDPEHRHFAWNLDRKLEITFILVCQFPYWRNLCSQSPPNSEVNIVSHNINESKHAKKERFSQTNTHKVFASAYLLEAECFYLIKWEEVAALCLIRI